MNKKIHTIIFDLDGTLSNSGILTVEALKTIAPVQGLPIPSEEAIRRATGYATPEFYFVLFPGFPRDLILKTGEMVDREEQRLIPSFACRLLFDGCRELLTKLKEHGISLHIASTGDRDHVLSVLSSTGITDFFDSINYGRPDKTKMLEEITAGIDKTGCAMVGDMEKDYKAAGANGILSIGACYGYCVPELAHFDLYITSPLELLDVLEIDSFSKAEVLEKPKTGG